MVRRHGFSLVELSIVLVILGLLTGGILAGQSLIRAAELRSVTAEGAGYFTAVHSFRDKYWNLPGDMPNATVFWGVADGNGADIACRDKPTTDGKTCNGNGNGAINNSPVLEWLRVWQHLADAGLIEGNYTGTLATFSGYSANTVGGVNSPRSKMANMIWGATGDSAAIPGSTTAPALNPANLILSVTANNASVSVADSLGLKPENAWNLDMKLDDGSPMTGRVVAVKGDGTNTFCTTAAGTAPPGDAGSTYRLTNNNRDCAIYLLIQ